MKILYVLLILTSFINLPLLSSSGPVSRKRSSYSQVCSLAQDFLVTSIRTKQPFLQDDIENDIRVYHQAFPHVLKKKYTGYQHNFYGKSVLQIAEEVGNYRAVQAILDCLTEQN